MYNGSGNTEEKNGRKIRAKLTCYADKIFAYYLQKSDDGVWTKVKNSIFNSNFQVKQARQFHMEDWLHTVLIEFIYAIWPCVRLDKTG